MNRMSPSLEDYLEMIYFLRTQNESVRTTDVANAIGVSKPSVNQAIKSLKEKGLADQERYGGVTLTDKGTEIAKRVLGRHNLIKQFLVDVLGVDESTAEQEACAMEHCIGESTIQKLRNYLSKVLG
ncbi:MAG: metal-dependent transcriptional regulator [Firmicutes bacterium]|nr:metal-dependent transcriptional regulator [Bacillota bacterium]